MTSVNLVKSDLTAYFSFECSGHSGYSEEGSDIICAAVSTATELVIGILENFSVDLKLDIRNEQAYVYCEIAQSENNSQKQENIANVLDGYAKYLNEISNAYPKYLKCTLTKV